MITAERLLKSISSPVGLRLGLAAIFLGLVFELVCVLWTTPGTFVAFALLGLPLIGAGVTVYLVHVIRELTRRGAL